MKETYNMKNEKDFNENELKPFRGDYNKCGYYRIRNNSWQVVIPCQWEEADVFHEGLARVRDDKGKFGFIDINGRVKIPCEWRFAGYFNEGLASVQGDNGKFGFIDKCGDIVIPCKSLEPSCFFEGLTQIKDNNEKEASRDNSSRQN